MRPLAYWTAATILVVTLLGAVFSGANFIAEQKWPFAPIWGGFMTGLGVVLIIIARAFPRVLWGISKSATETDPRILHRAASIASIFGVVIIIGGVAFALTARVGALVGAWAVAALFLRAAVPRSGNDDLPGPAA